MRFRLIVLFIVIVKTAYPQYYPLSYGFGVGTSHFIGEFGLKEGEDKGLLAGLQPQSTRWSAQGFIRYEVARLISFNGSFSYARLSGADKHDKNQGRRMRNLSFNNNVFELSPRVEFVFLSLNNYYRNTSFPFSFWIYATAGVGVFYHAPSTKYEGKTYYLRKLKTENVAYSPFSISLPVGGGAYMSVKRKFRLGFEVLYRFTRTDYLDDVSTVYANPDIMKADPLRYGISYRSDEAGSGKSYADEGDTRGNPKIKDNFFTFQVSISYPLKSSGVKRGFNPNIKRFGGGNRKKGKRARF